MESRALQQSTPSGPAEREIVDHLVEHFDAYPGEVVVTTIRH
jgi:hypothetical protein